MNRVPKILALLSIAAAVASDAYSQPVQLPADWPDWAYGVLSPLEEGDRIAPACPSTARPIDCAYPGRPVPDDGIQRSLPGAAETHTRNQAYANYGPADWYPGDHPPMPAIVANGNEPRGIRACALCHYPNGQGKMENGHVAGLPAEYILQQLAAFAAGTRRSADPRKANTNEMAMIAATMTDAEKQQVAEYYSSTPYRPMVRVIETDEAPAVRATGNGLMLPLEGEPPIPLGNRIIEVPEFPERTEMMRDPRGGFVAYAPVGSLARGEALVTTGASKTVQCSVCHGQDNMGLGPIPGIAGRTASYIMRQLWDMKQGTRASPLMAPVIANLTQDEMLAISAYIASLSP